MSPVEIIILSFALSADAFAVALTSGFVIEHPKIRHALKIAVFFGGFQALMPAIGWALGGSVRNLIASVDHWIAFGLLFFIGLKMIFESVQSNPQEEAKNPLDLLVLLGLSVATSIDALAAGISFAFLKIAVMIPVLTIGLVTFSMSFLGVLAGHRFGHLLENKAKMLGGAVLIFIGIRILLEHLK